ncbi:MAG: hypothetical protein KKG14_01975 [Alphaproteobacteria bacterium]|nr:hypothetical protein [Alphaproteobacteria bacterium]MBU2269674.1 hypothetical protein [Alphaproteobacteria bacterium]MBU2417453.1 hypothetical protein [Alphaproteobacteria bacterium]
MRPLAVAAVLMLGSAQLASCEAPSAAPTDERIIADLAADRDGFGQIADLLEPGSPVSRVERRESGWLVLPQGSDGNEAGQVQRFLTRHDIGSAAGRPADGQPGRQVWFVLYEGKPDGFEYQSKTLIRGTPDREWRFVDDTDRAVVPPLSDPKVVYRAVGDRWYIRNSAL